MLFRIVLRHQNHQRTERPRDQRTKGSEDHGTRGPRDQRTRVPGDSKTTSLDKGQTLHQAGKINILLLNPMPGYHGHHGHHGHGNVVGRVTCKHLQILRSIS